MADGTYDIIVVFDKGKMIKKGDPTNLCWVKLGNEGPTLKLTTLWSASLQRIHLSLPRGPANGIAGDCFVFSCFFPCAAVLYLIN